MVSRRALMMAGAGFVLAAGPARPAAIMTDDGYYTEDWFIDSFLELADDRRNAAAAGRQLAVVWEQRGCPYCRDMHLIDFADRTIEAYVRDHFDVLELNLHGSRIVTDFDGERLGEREFAAKYGILGTPTIQFFPDGGDLGALAPRDREVNRIRGYLPPGLFLAMFAFVGERAYEHEPLRDFMREQT